MQMDFENELEAAFAASAGSADHAINYAPDELVERIMSSEPVVRLILRFLSISHERVETVCKVWDRVHQQMLRQQTRSLFLTVLPDGVATAVESALYSGCGQRAGRGEYNGRTRRILLNLRSNEELRQRVADGRQSPVQLVAMRPEDMATKEQQALVSRLEAEAIEAGKKRQAPADVSGIWLCEGCGSTRQWVRRYVRGGSGDVTKYSEILICCDCGKTVEGRKQDLWLGTAVAGRASGGVTASSGPPSYREGASSLLPSSSAAAASGPRESSGSAQVLAAPPTAEDIGAEHRSSQAAGSATATCSASSLPAAAASGVG